MTDEPTPTTPTPPGPPTRPKRPAHTVLMAVRALQVRLRFILVLAAALGVASQWDTLRNYWDRLTRTLVVGSGPMRAVSPNTEYFCPMDPVVVSKMPGKCDICNMALVRRSVGEMAPLPSGVLARMQLSPYRVQLAGIRTAPVEYRPTAREVALIGMVREDGLVECRVPEHERPFVAVGQAAEVVLEVNAKPPGLRGEVSALEVDQRPSGTTALVRLERAGPTVTPGTRVVATVRRPIAELGPFRSLPSGPPPLASGGPLTVYVCPQHPEVLATDRGRCPVDRENNLRPQTLLDNQRVGWWCPMHPNVTADQPGASCKDCGGMKLVARVITYRPPGQVLSVPESAVVDTGTRRVVFVERTPGTFDGVEVDLGPRCGDVYPVAAGLEPGQRVVVNGAFLLDAETRLNPSVAAGYFGAGAGRSARDEPGASSQGVCPVTGKPLGSMGPPVTVTVDGQTVQLCCKACEDKLRKSPEKYLPRPKSQ